MTDIKEKDIVQGLTLALYAANVVSVAPIALAASLFMKKEEAAKMMNDILTPEGLFVKEEEDEEDKRH